MRTRTFIVVILVALFGELLIYQTCLGKFRSFHDSVSYQVRYRSRSVGCYFVNNVDYIKNQEIMKIVMRILYAIDGRFGNKVLKPQYRSWWRLFTYGTLVILLFRFVLVPILNWWQGVVDFLNYVIWG